MASGLVTAGALLFLFVSLGVVVLFSFHSTGGLTLPFEGFSLRWYEDVLGDATFTEALLNSVILGISTAVIAVVLGTAAAYGLSRSSTRLGGPLQALFVAPVLLPGLFIGAALLSFLSRIEFQPSLLTVLIGHVVFAFPFVFSWPRPRSTGSTSRSRRSPGTSAPYRGGCFGR